MIIFKGFFFSFFFFFENRNRIASFVGRAEHTAAQAPRPEPSERDPSGAAGKTIVPLHNIGTAQKRRGRRLNVAAVVAVTLSPY